MSLNQLRVLVVYFTRTANTKKVCDLVQGEFLKLGITPIIESVNYKDSKPGAWQYIKHVVKAGVGSKYTLDAQPTNDASQFDIVIFGAPVWDWSFAPPILEWMKMSKFNRDRTSFGLFIQMGGSGFEKCVKQTESELKTKVTSFIATKDAELRNSEELTKKVSNFVNEMLRLHEQRQSSSVVSPDEEKKICNS
eukprot:MONOS_8062.1-p1 / transcript=MONOS_8062.1 / gene=MONOS_8062 / organism=Monocercomonoides_exilis_PA203 / gene_product=unspecified product / transcript_product=unspecified product / location=Mono_scaffold00293:66516-67366(+) / protein_length=192 / sequence_SO=supercontig / SO=protein_coding / is_pseudo=false